MRERTVSTRDGAFDRREVLAGGLAGVVLVLLKDAPRVDAAPSLLGFTAIPTSRDDAVILPREYRWEVLCAWGDPISDGPLWKADASNSAADQLLQLGMHHDGMEFFSDPAGDSGAVESGLLVINHEYVDTGLLGPPNGSPKERAEKAQAAHGLSILELGQRKGRWGVVRPSKRSWRLTPSDPVLFTGPARDAPEITGGLKPPFENGTLANCSCGRTPWGSYLTCEENFDWYFNRKVKPFTEFEKLYGLEKQTYKLDWFAHDKRFDLDEQEWQANRYGWVVEVDPRDRSRRPLKHTALGRLKHENACVVAVPGKRLTVYMGDDERGQFLYKFVSAHAYAPDRTELRDAYLTEGTLYAARFDSEPVKGAPAWRGRWLPLDCTRDARLLKAFEKQERLLVFTRRAAEVVEATRMDRPEWVTRHPRDGRLYVSLTNNKDRAAGATNEANPREKNIYGHILSWAEDGDDPAAETFTYERFLLAGDPSVAKPGETPHTDNPFGCPDGLSFDSRGVLWVQTDVASGDMGTPEFDAIGNNQMLAVDPNTREVRRFLTGPVGCELTGFVMMPDARSLLVNIQHPGESSKSTWPHGLTGIAPRSATILITRCDGGIIGS